MKPKSLALYIIDTNDSILPERRAEAIDFVNAQADELATLRAQLERLARRLNWIRINPNDAVALHFALEATDKEIDDVKHLITERDE